MSRFISLAAGKEKIIYSAKKTPAGAGACFYIKTRF